MAFFLILGLIGYILGGWSGVLWAFGITFMLGVILGD